MNLAASPLPAFSTAGPVGEPPGSPAWQRTAARARMLSWLTLGWLGVEAGVAIAGALTAGSIALLGFGLDSGIEALASIVVIWRLSGSRRSSETAERRGQRLVAISFLLLGPYIAVEALLDLASGSHPETSLVGIALTGFTVIFEPSRSGQAPAGASARLGNRRRRRYPESSLRGSSRRRARGPCRQHPLRLGVARPRSWAADSGYRHTRGREFLAGRRLRLRVRVPDAT